MNQIMDCDQGI